MIGRRAGPVLAVLLMWTLAASAPAHACAYDNESHDLSLDTVDHYYPGAYGVVLKVVEARRTGSLKRLIEPDANRLFAFQRLLRVVRTFEGHMRSAARQSVSAGSSPPSVAMLLVESMLWVRFPETLAEGSAQVHVAAPVPGDLVLVLGDDAMAAIVDGKLDIAQAEQRGFLHLHGAESSRVAFRLIYAPVGRNADRTER